MHNHGPSLFVGIICVLLLAAFTTPQLAFAVGKPFGGKIINMEAPEVEALEDAGFSCMVPGDDLVIQPKGQSPISYVIPTGTMSKTQSSARQNVWILGLYTPSSTTVTCIYDSYPPIEVTLQLNTITMYGVSKM